MLSNRLDNEIQECDDEVDKYNDYLAEIVFGRSSAEEKQEKANHRKSIKFWNKRKVQLLKMKDYVEESKLLLKQINSAAKGSGEIVWGVYEK